MEKSAGKKCLERARKMHQKCGKNVTERRKQAVNPILQSVAGGAGLNPTEEGSHVQREGGSKTKKGGEPQKEARGQKRKRKGGEGEAKPVV